MVCHMVILLKPKPQNQLCGLNLREKIFDSINTSSIMPFLQPLFYSYRRTLLNTSLWSSDQYSIQLQCSRLFLFHKLPNLLVEDRLAIGLMIWNYIFFESHSILILEHSLILGHQTVRIFSWNLDLETHYR